MLVLKPLPGERRKSSTLLLYERPWRSKWWRVRCTGDAKRCRAGDCIHVQYAAAHHPRVKVGRGVAALNEEARAAA